jgi:protein-arginine kinase activator protein McsA
MDLKLNDNYLDELVGFIGRNLTGKILKKFEIVENKETLKQLIKETIYEEMRHFKDLILSANFGLEITQFNLKK